MIKRTGKSGRKYPSTTFYAAVPCLPYLLALVSSDSVIASPASSYSYEIWNLTSFTIFKNRTQYLTIDDKSTVRFYKFPTGGLYTLLYNNPEYGGTLTSVKVGLLLGGSYLVALGYFLTIPCLL